MVETFLLLSQNKLNTTLSKTWDGLFNTLKNDVFEKLGITTSSNVRRTDYLA